MTSHCTCICVCIHIPIYIYIISPAPEYTNPVISEIGKTQTDPRAPAQYVPRVCRGGGGVEGVTVVGLLWT